MLCGYNPTNKLGEGGYGSVVLVKDKKGKGYALKIPEDPIYIEVDILSRLSHPNILHADRILVKSQNCNIKHVAYLLPLSKGSLRDLIKTKPFSMMQLVSNVASAMEFLHRNDIVHCDLRLHNILIFDRGFVVADFGISTYLKQGEEIEGGLSAPESYLSPEAVKKGSRTSSMIDVWMFGILCLEYHLGGYWDSREKYKVREHILQNVPKLLAEQIPDPFFRIIITSCLDSDPYKRPTMREICDAVSVKPIGNLIHDSFYESVPHSRVASLVNMMRYENKQTIFLAVNLLNKTKISGKPLYLFIDKLLNRRRDQGKTGQEITKITRGILNDDPLYSRCKNKNQIELCFRYVILSNPNIYPYVDLDRWFEKIGNI
jgi:serine/threonine protein kinase